MVPMPENSTNDTLAFALNNFAILLQDVDPRNFSGEAFSVNLGPIQEAINNTSRINEESLVTMMTPLPNATASAELPESLFTTNTPGNPVPRRRVIFSVFLTNTLFLTPETDCTNSTIGSVVLGIGVNSSVPNFRLSSGGIRLVFQQYREVRTCNTAAVASLQQSLMIRTYCYKLISISTWWIWVARLMVYKPLSKFGYFGSHSLLCLPPIAL